MGKRSRNKGKRGEREVAELLRQFGFSSARRGQQYNGIDGRDVVGLPGHHVEVKRTERLRLYPALKQAEQDAKDGEVPIVFYRANREDWVVILKAKDYLELISNGNSKHRCDKGN